MIGIPEKYPYEMVEALKKFLPSISSVKSVYLLLMVRGEKDKSFLLVVDTDGNINDVFCKIANKATKILIEGRTIGFGAFITTFWKSAVEGQIPFYER